MIIIDYSAIAISNIVTQKLDIQEDMIRHMILNSIRMYRAKFKDKFGEVIMTGDAGNNWRYNEFPQYKAARKKNRKESKMDWQEAFRIINLVWEELGEHFPYKTIKIDGCEADDVIAVLATRYAASQKVMILSSDKDFAQLQKFPNVEQYSPILKKFIKEPLPSAQLKQLVIRGDKSDGIPNILSKDDTFVEGVRQKPITEAKIINWMNQSPEEFCTDEMLRNFKRNEMLIDLTRIPEALKETILHTYEEAKGKTKQEFMNYIITNRLKNLLEVIDEF